MSTLHQLSRSDGRRLKVRRNAVAALAGAPMRRAVVIKLAVTNPRKPNSGKRKYVKIRVIFSKKVVHAHMPGRGPNYIQEYSIVMVEGGNPPDVPGVNYSLIRGVYDFDQSEEFGRRKKRSKFGAKKPLYSLNEK